jgi:hypothetical protein
MIILVEVGFHNMYGWYWRVLLPQVITFDPEGAMA